MLIDDNQDDNFYHEREIKKVDQENVVVTKHSGMEALEYLASKKEPRSDLIFLDINMPGMNGWEFLEEYNNLDSELQSRAIIVMVTTSSNPDDIKKSKTFNFITDYIIKPLTREKVKEIRAKYFSH